MQLRIGSRGSKLALTQTKLIEKALKEANPGLETEIIIIKTKGDLILDKPLNEIGDKGLFVREIEEALLDHKIDLAVHSLKDMPAEQPEGLEMAVTPLREDPRDVLISFTGAKQLSDLPQGATIATGSLRRITQLNELRPDLEIKGIRGNVETRIKKAREQGYAGIVLAASGLNRLGMNLRGSPSPPKRCSPPRLKGFSVLRPAPTMRKPKRCWPRSIMKTAIASLWRKEPSSATPKAAAMPPWAFTVIFTEIPLP